jgi:hypothetical protein
MACAKAEQLTPGYGNCGQLVEGLTEGSCIMDWPRQLHHLGGDSHRRKSASGYVLPQRTCYYHPI